MLLSGVEPKTFRRKRQGIGFGNFCLEACYPPGNGRETVKTRANQR